MRNSIFSGFKPQGIINNEDKKLRYIDAAYLIGVFLVILGHSHPLTEAWYDTWIKYLNGFIYSFHMHLYFFIAGYLLVHSHSIDKIGYVKWAFNKLLKFGVPYLVLTAIAYFPKALLGNTVDNVEMNFGYFLRTTFLEPRDGVWGHFWFITAFITIDLIWGIWRYYSPKNKLVYRFGLILGGCISLTLAIIPLDTKLFTLHDISEVSIFYFIGIVIALAKPVLWNKKYKLYIGISVSAIAVYFLYQFGNYMNYRGKTLTFMNIFNGRLNGNESIFDTAFFNFLVSLLLVWICWCLAVLLGDLKRFNLPQKVSKYLFNIFIYAWPAQATVETLLRGTSLHWFTISLIMFIVGCVVPIAIVFIYQKATFAHCKFFDYLIGVKTVVNKSKGELQS